MGNRDGIAHRAGQRLALVSGAQLVANVAGMVIGIRRHRAYNWLFIHGNPDAVARDSVLQGTGLSAPMYMLLAQLIATRTLLRSPDNQTATKVLRGLGAAMVPGYLGESIVRERLRPSRFDPVETPIAITGVALAAAMAALPSRHRSAIMG